MTCARYVQRMKPRINLLTLAVADLERSIAFYRDGLGLVTNGVAGEQFEDGAVAFFKLDGGLTLALYPAVSLGKDAMIVASDQRLGAVSIGHLVKDRAEVDRVVAVAKNAGAVVTDSPRARFWGGYSGYFHDPDGHLWEIAWNPEWEGAD
jgi:catechol 2,3-dioxygenase-like lactoylglutathione lyase family enzyme